MANIITIKGYNSSRNSPPPPPPASGLAPHWLPPPISIFLLANLETSNNHTMFRNNHNRSNKSIHYTDSSSCNNEFNRRRFNGLLLSFLYETTNLRLQDQERGKRPGLVCLLSFYGSKRLKLCSTSLAKSPFFLILQEEPAE